MAVGPNDGLYVCSAVRIVEVAESCKIRPVIEGDALETPHRITVDTKNDHLLVYDKGRKQVLRFSLAAS